MRIHSRFHDYYDRAMAQGADQTRVFMRETTEYNDNTKGAEVPAHLARLAGMLKGGLSSGRVSLQPFLVAFCGKLYPGVRCLVQGSSMDNPPTESKAEFVYNLEELLRFCTAHKVSLDEEHLFSNDTQKQRFAAFFALTGSEKLAPDLAERQVGIAVALARSPAKVLVNPALKNFHFFRVFDAWQAYQELSMYLGSLAAPDTKPPVQVADADRIRQHGFDRQSFRKRPQSK